MEPLMKRLLEDGPGSQTSFGLFRGDVIRNDDPEKRARVQVRIVQVHGDGLDPSQTVASDRLPWAEPCFPMSGFADGGVYFVPPVPSTLWCAFENGDPHRPVYLGGWWKNDEPPAEVTDPDEQRVIKTPAGHVLLFDDAPDGIIRLSHEDGDREIILDGNTGTTTIKNKSGQTIVLNETAQSVTVTNGTQVITLDGASGTINIQNGATQSATMNETAQTINIQNGPLQTVLMNALLSQVVLTNGVLQVLTLDGLLQTTLLINGLVQVLTNGILGKVQINTLTVDGIELGTGAAAETYGIVVGAFKTLFDGHTHAKPAGCAGGAATGPPAAGMVVGTDISTIVKAKAMP